MIERYISTTNVPMLNDILVLSLFVIKLPFDVFQSGKHAVDLLSVRCCG